MSARQASSDEWEAGVLRLHAEAAGAYTLLLVSPAGALDLSSRAAAGDAKAFAYIGALEIFGKRLLGARRDAPMCLCCDQILSRRTPPYLIGLFHALSDRPSDCLTVGLCRSCAKGAPDLPALRNAVIGALRQVFPDLTACDGVMAPAGHA